MLLLLCLKGQEDLPDMQVLHCQVDQVPVPGEDGVLHDGDGDDHQAP